MDSSTLARPPSPSIGIVPTGGADEVGHQAFKRPNVAHKKEVFFLIHRLSTGQLVDILDYAKSIVDRLVAQSVQ